MPAKTCKAILPYKKNGVTGVNMSYSRFAYWYDYLNHDADYDSLAAEILLQLNKYGVVSGLVADLGCGTGELTLRLADAGYDMIAVDRSEDMLSIFSEKLEKKEKTGVLLLNQNLSELDLYGTIRAAVSTFDTLNHLHRDELYKSFEKVALFMEPNGVFIFDANTPYKHHEVLANREFVVEDGRGAICFWNNSLLPEQEATLISLSAEQDGEILFREEFLEYIYPLEFWQKMLCEAGFSVLNVQDGETFAPVTNHSQRYLITAMKIK